ncbi:MAG: molybdopterin-dependent oxidoreductase [Comamonadaceae bacterium]|nr:molybdopterin-dependent oxidoreductase [Comamonadaceae bacterium]
MGCQLELNVKDGKVVKVTTPRWNASAPNHGSLCIKGRFGYDFLDHPDRLTKPMIRVDGELKEASWDEAISYIVGQARRHQRKAWSGCRCRFCLGAVHQRGELPLPEILAGGDQAPTTSITAPGSDTAPPWPVWPQHSAAGR